MKPTTEQQAIIDFIEESKESLVVNALAGAAKTTTLCMIAEKELEQPILAVAFNVKIKHELERRLPKTITCLTLNGLGHRAWSSHIKRRLKLETGKTGDILKQIIKEFKIELASDEFISILELISSCKTVGLVPKELNKFSPIPLVPDSQETWERLCVECDLDATAETIKLAKKVLIENVRQAYEGLIDFNDQLYMSVCFNATFPKFKTILIDEAQDLSTMNHYQIYRASMKETRVVILGDRNQSIYAFRGAAGNSIDTLAEHYNAEEFELTTTFRCDSAICDVVRPHVPAIQPRPGADVGKVEFLEEWDAAKLERGSAVLCRNNAPLLRVASDCLALGIPVQVLGRDVGKSLIKILHKFHPSISGPELATTITTWGEGEIEKAKNDAKIKRITDQMDCLLAILGTSNKTTDELIATVTQLFADKASAITFATGHKCKGLEWDTVYHLDWWRIPSRYAKEALENGDPVPMEQERNLQYVINTRAKHQLFLISTEKGKL